MLFMIDIHPFVFLATVMITKYLTQQTICILMTSTGYMFRLIISHLQASYSLIG
jgi:hypothetical protein